MTSVAARIASLNAQARAAEKVVFSGHGGWLAADGTFIIPAGTTITFYQPDAVSLGNEAGKLVDALTRFGTGANAHEVLRGGQSCKNYRLYPRETLALLGHSKFEERFVTTNVPGGVQLKDLLSTYRGKDCHWAACRNHM